MNISDIL